MSRYVVLHHECPPGYVKPSHWDFMLEAEKVLWTWELRELPGKWLDALGQRLPTPEKTIVASRLADHRLAYLDYEGPLTENRGRVTRVAAGEFELLVSIAERIVIRLLGEPLTGTVELVALNQLGRWKLTVGN